MDGSVITVIGSVLVAIVSGTLALLSGRKKASADHTAAIASGFEVLLKTMQREREELVRANDKLASKVESLEVEVTTLTRHIGRLERALIEAGVAIPVPPNDAR